MSEYILIANVKLTGEHHQTGKTRHFIQGSLMNIPDALTIVRFEGDEGYYLLYLDIDGNELTDTYHDSLTGALEQAQFEFGVEYKEWKYSQ